MSASLQGLDKFKFDVSGSNIKSIQRGTTAHTFAGSTKTYVTINAVDLTKSIVLVDFPGLGAGAEPGINKIVTSCEFVTSTQLAFTLGTADTFGSTFSWTVIEFNNVKSFQTGASSTSAQNINITISNVNLNKSLLFYSQTSNVASTNYIYSLISGVLSTNTSIVFTMNTVTGAGLRNIIWYVIEFN